MKNKNFLTLMQRYVANIAISGSTLRNQGAKGVTKIAREFLAELDLKVLNKIIPSGYPEQLDKWTIELKRKLPSGAKNWGTARKAINVFMVQAFLNKYLTNEYGLSQFGDALETPLDSQSTSRLRQLAGRGALPRWTSIKNLRAEHSARYQEFALKLAKRYSIPRACLDMILWRAAEKREIIDTHGGWPMK